MDRKVTLNFKEEKIGLALASGGFLGAYELGALKYLREAGIGVDDFDSIIGTSVGAVNLVSLLANGLDKTIELFLNVSSNDIYNGNLVKINTRYKLLNNILSKILKKIYTAPNNIGNLALVARGLFGHLDNSPLKKYLDDNITDEGLDKILNTDKDIALCTTKLKGFKTVVADKSILTKDNIFNYVMASSSAYPVFPKYTINGEKYVDGGYKDSCNAQYLFKNFGCDKVVILDLADNREKWQGYKSIAYVYPTADLGSFLDTNKEQINKNFEQGYRDARIYFEDNVEIIK